MPARDVLLAVLIAAVWGANFTVIKIGLAGVPPMLLASLRYLAAAVPAVFLVPRPKAPARLWVVYGLTVGVGQFGALFWAMDRGMPAGLASVVLQSQAFFTLLFSAALLKERIRAPELAGIAVSGAGLVAIAMSLSRGAANIPPSAFLLSLSAAAFWGISNIVVRRAVEAAAQQGASLDMLGLVVWSSLVPPIPLSLLALLLHSPPMVARAFTQMEAASLFAIAYIAYGSTLFGYGGWSVLLGRHPASKVAPYSLLVPVTGLLTAGVVLGEQLTLTQWLGSGCIVAGLVLLSLFRSPQTRERDEATAASASLIPIDHPDARTFFVSKQRRTKSSGDSSASAFKRE
jgi:Permeases of the drug/metabolite transporter (DMT) superfamily